ncbi:DNA alkylation repair protein [Leucobacter zeae]|nr:DNA alkylation repair protein [Leucobacter zeae]
MDAASLVAELRAVASPERKRSVARLGIPEDRSIGVSVPEVRRIAKRAGRDDAVADALWATGIHEARLLAALVYDPRTFRLERADGLVADVVSWDLCDHLCNGLFVRLPGYASLIERWQASEPLYTRRAAFSLMASAATHEREIPRGLLARYLDWIESAAADPRDHVRKAVAWALREIGQRDLVHRDLGIALADRLIASGDRSRKWVGTQARKELVELVRVEGRRRLVPARSAAGRAAAASTSG